jgi:hypothetical protein
VACPHSIKCCHSPTHNYALSFRLTKLAEHELKSAKISDQWMHVLDPFNSQEMLKVGRAMTLPNSTHASTWALFLPLMISVRMQRKFKASADVVSFKFPTIMNLFRAITYGNISFIAKLF